MDAVYVYRHSHHDDFEIRYSLRSLAQYAPYIRKVWVYGDKPRFLSNDTSLIQHVPHEYTARLLGIKTPVINFCLLMVLSSLIPELDFEYLLFSDDQLLLRDCSIEEARKVRYLNDMEDTQPPFYAGLGRQWKMELWRTTETLTRLGYRGLNFETHTPTWLTKKIVFEAYSDFRQFISDDRFFGFCGPTGILNHGLKHSKLELTRLHDENTFSGFWLEPPSSCEEVFQTAEGKLFFNYDEPAFGETLQEFMMKKFPEPCKYEKTDAESAVDASHVPKKDLFSPDALRKFLIDNYPRLAQELKLTTSA